MTRQRQTKRPMGRPRLTPRPERITMRVHPDLYAEIDRRRRQQGTTIRQVTEEALARGLGVPLPTTHKESA